MVTPIIKTLDKAMSDRLSPLSYGSLKLILEYVNLDTRLKIRHCIPEVQPTESLTPCHLDQFSITSGFSQPPTSPTIKVNYREWIFQKIDGNQNETEVVFSYWDLRQVYLVPLSPEKAFNKLAERYLRNESRIQMFFMEKCPKFLSDKDPRHFQLFIDELYLSNSEKESFSNFRRFITLKRLTMSMDQDTIDLLKEPIVENIDELLLWFCQEETVKVDDVMLLLKNRVVKILDAKDKIRRFPNMNRKWLFLGRPSGTKFGTMMYSIRNISAST